MFGPSENEPVRWLLIKTETKIQQSGELTPVNPPLSAKIGRTQGGGLLGSPSGP